MSRTLISWNVNGIRAVEKKGFGDWLQSAKPYILGIQETKARPEQLTFDLLNPAGYTTYWSSAERKGYSGVAVFAQEEPINVYHAFEGVAKDTEGRILVLEYPTFFFLTIYFPNGKNGNERLAYKLQFYADFLAYIKKLKKKKKTIIVCGDVNTAHKEIDLARPKENRDVSGFLPEECAWLDRFIAEGLVDTFRHQCPEPGQYSWWDYKTRARERNIGWRIDYFYIDNNSIAKLKDAFILKDVLGSDHCPVGIRVDE